MKIVNTSVLELEETPFVAMACSGIAALILLMTGWMPGEVHAIPPIPPDSRAVPDHLLQQLPLTAYPNNAIRQAYVKNPWPSCQRGEQWQWSSGLNQIASSTRLLPRFLAIEWHCEQPAASNKAMAHIHVWVPTWVAKRNLPAGYPLTSADLDERWVDALVQTSARTQNLAIPKEGWDNQMLKKPLMAGQSLQDGWLRHPDDVDSGQRVTLRLQGQGFALDSEGVLMQPSRVGHTVKVKTPQGKVLTGKLDRDGIVLVQ